MDGDRPLSAGIEPFDTFWEAPEDIERGYRSFGRFYTVNYLKRLPRNRDASILIVSCGAGYFVNLLAERGYRNVLGIDSDPVKIEHAKKRNLNCRRESAFPFLENNREAFDAIIAEQEINHLTKEEILRFLALCRAGLRGGGRLVLHSLNGANPITGSEAVAQNFDHYNAFTEYSLRQVLRYAGYEKIEVFPLRLFVFYQNPANYAGIVADGLLTLLFRLLFRLYGKTNSIFSKKIAAVCRKPI